MTKVIYEQAQGTTSNNVNLTMSKGTDVELVSNANGMSPLRIDKAMIQYSGSFGASTMTAAHPICVLVHLSDKKGASLTSDVTTGTTSPDTFQTLIQKWKDNIFMIDYQMIGSGFDESNIFVSNLEADTRRILEPGQKLLFTVFHANQNTDNIQFKGWLDAIVWYSPASQ